MALTSTYTWATLFKQLAIAAMPSKLAKPAASPWEISDQPPGPMVARRCRETVWRGLHNRTTSSDLKEAPH